MGVKNERFSAQLTRFQKISLDSTVLIYHLEDIAPYSELTEIVFAAIAAGSVTAALSTICVTELLVKPFAEGEMDRVEACEHFVLSLPGMVLIPPDYTVAREAARLRGKYRVRTPDALLLATALTEKAQAFVTNDGKLRKLSQEGIAVIVLDEYA
ncbi:PIN domain-containing protein [Acidobacteria bacterium AH-259-G07]|nr:PIN domain-containing protein [Acidobacteria bacterium AH-259-G07]